MCMLWVCRPGIYCSWADICEILAMCTLSLSFNVIFVLLRLLLSLLRFLGLFGLFATFGDCDVSLNF